MWYHLQGVGKYAQMTRPEEEEIQNNYLPVAQGSLGAPWNLELLDDPRKTQGNYFKWFPKSCTLCNYRISDNKLESIF